MKALTTILLTLTLLLTFSGTAFAKPSLPSEKQILSEVVQMKAELQEYKMAQAGNKDNMPINGITIITLFIAVISIIFSLIGLSERKMLKKEMYIAMAEIRRLKSGTPPKTRPDINRPFPAPPGLE